MKRRGFTLIELLVVIAIIGMLSTLAVVALNSARSKARDAKRVADIKQVQTALELYYNDNEKYPIATGALGAGNFVCLNDTGFTTAGCLSPYMGLVPKDPQTGTYAYTSPASGLTYSITFAIEGPVGGFTVGTITASQDGMTQ